MTILDLTSILVELNLLDEKLGVKKGKKKMQQYLQQVWKQRGKNATVSFIKGFCPCCSEFTLT